jgi:hypothetical protein
VLEAEAALGVARPLAGSRLIVHDVAADGRWLTVREDLTFGVRARVPDASGLAARLAALEARGVAP